MFEGYYWIILFIVLLVVEILTLGLTTIWFAIGALGAGLASLVTDSLVIQIIVFVVVSVATLIFTRPLVKKHFNNSRVATNANRYIGESGMVIEDINTLTATGRVEVKGQEWAAKTADPEGKLAKGTTIVVKGIEGVNFIVEEKEKI